MIRLIALALSPLSTHHQRMKDDLASRVGLQAARRLSAFAKRARAMSPLPVLQVVLFGSRARGDAVRGSDWDIAVVVHAGGDDSARKARRNALNVFADLALSDITAGFHLRPIIISSAEDSLDSASWQVSPGFARNLMADGLLIS